MRGEVETIVIARDAESDVCAATQSIQASLQNVDLPCSQAAFNYESSGNLKVAYMIFPSPSEASGTLEDLCLMTVEDNPAMTCVDSFLDCIESIGNGLSRRHKNKLHSYLSSTDNYVGMKIGEASHAMAWNPNHSAFQPFKQIIEDM